MIKDIIFINTEPKEEARSKLQEKLSNKTNIKEVPEEAWHEILKVEIEKGYQTESID